MTTLWSKRWSVADGAFWRRERECAADTAQAWLALFSRDEPHVKFVLADKAPSTSPPTARSRYGR